ncbi:MAG: carbohydrate kinase [Saprospiraceae bacterium]|nr:carbohydrate kinase [Saprospiraceae bacterium]
MYLLGYDIGSSSIKAALVSIESGEKIAVVQSPAQEMEIHSPQPGWAEQHPDTWWDNLCLATKKLLEKTGAKPAEIKGIGIAYQMHGLVLVDKNHEALRPSIIWCDSRAVGIGNRAFDEIGHERCLSHLLNSPGNFTASKLKWVQENEPSVFEKTHKFMLPGDYIAMKLTGEIMTTASGLSEGIFWDFKKNEVAGFVLDHFGFDKKLIPDIAPTFSPQGKLSKAAAAATGLAEGTPVAYRAGDQPNNALSLNVLEPGEVAATGGTSGVVYGVVDKPKYDPQSRVNSFLHVNHGVPPHTSYLIPHTSTRIGILLCINGAGSQYAWVKQQIATDSISYFDMENLAASVPVGANGLRILPFGNGAERMLGNRDIGSKVNNLHFSRHSRAHFYRAALEGIAFSFVYGMGILKEMGLNVQVMRVGNDNLFQSAVFSNTISNLVDSRIEMVETTGAVGAAKAAGVATGFFSSVGEAMKGGKVLLAYEPDSSVNGVYEEAYRAWEMDLREVM